jgi:hypothetical protein
MKPGARKSPGPNLKSWASKSGTLPPVGVLTRTMSQPEQALSEVEPRRNLLSMSPDKMIGLPSVERKIPARPKLLAAGWKKLEDSQLKVGPPPIQDPVRPPSSLKLSSAQEEDELICAPAEEMFVPSSSSAWRDRVNGKAAAISTTGIGRAHAFKFGCKCCAPGAGPVDASRCTLMF